MKHGVLFARPLHIQRVHLLIKGQTEIRVVVAFSLLLAVSVAFFRTQLLGNGGEMCADFAGEKRRRRFEVRVSCCVN